MAEEVEIWKDVPGYEGLYQASTFGRIKALAKNKTIRYSSGIVCSYISREKIIKTPVGRYGYMCLCLIKNGVRSSTNTHRVICITFNDNPSNLDSVDHIDCNKLNNKPSNLRWCTRSENTSFAWDNKIYKRIGSDNGRSKITEAIVVIIKNKISSGEKLCDIAKELSINAQIIRHINKGRTWKHVLA